MALLAAILGSVLPPIVSKIVGSGLIEPQDASDVYRILSSELERGLPQDVGGMMPHNVGGFMNELRRRGAGKRKTRKSRKPSAYNKFVGAQRKKDQP